MKIADIIAQRALAGDDTTRARNKINNMVRATILRPSPAPGERFARDFDFIETVLTHVAFDWEDVRVGDAVLRQVLEDLRRQLEFGKAYEECEPWTRVPAHGCTLSPDAWLVVKDAVNHGFAWLKVEGSRLSISASISRERPTVGDASDWAVSVRLKSLRLLGADLFPAVQNQKPHIDPADLSDDTE